MFALARFWVLWGSNCRQDFSNLKKSHGKTGKSSAFQFMAKMGPIQGVKIVIDRAFSAQHLEGKSLRNPSVQALAPT